MKKPKYTMQVGGPVTKPVIAEKGEYFKNTDGDVQQISLRAPSHDDKTLHVGGDERKARQGKAGVVVPNAVSLLSASQEQINAGDRKAEGQDVLIKIRPKEALAIGEAMGLGIDAKGAMSPSKLFEKLRDERDSRAVKLNKAIDLTVDDKFAKNSQQVIMAQAASLPTDDELYDAVFNLQESRKQEALPIVDTAQYGGAVMQASTTGRMIPMRGAPILDVTRPTTATDKVLDYSKLKKLKSSVASLEQAVKEQPKEAYLRTQLKQRRAELYEERNNLDRSEQGIEAVQEIAGDPVVSNIDNTRLVNRFFPGRASFDVDNVMQINPGSTGEYFAEAAHGVQLKNNFASLIDPLSYVQHALGVVSDDARNAPYKTPGSFEYEAHEVIEPKLWDVFNHFYDKPDNMRKLKRIGKRQSGGLSIDGYKDESPDVDNAYNVIPSNHITMDGVSQPLMLLGDGGEQVVAQPHSGDYLLPRSKRVLELPLAQAGGPIQLRPERRGYYDPQTDTWIESETGDVYNNNGEYVGPAGTPSELDGGALSVDAGISASRIRPAIRPISPSGLKPTLSTDLVKPYSPATTAPALPSSELPIGIPVTPEGLPMDPKASYNFPFKGITILPEVMQYLDAMGRENIRMEQIDFPGIHLERPSAEPQLAQNQRDFLTAMQNIDPASTVGQAMAAQLLGNKYAANNQVIGQAEQQRIQIENAEKTANQQGSLEVGMKNIALRQDFEQKRLLTSEAQRTNKHAAVSSIVKKIQQHDKFNRQMDLLNDLFQNYKVGPQGLQRVGETYFTPNGGGASSSGFTPTRQTVRTDAQGRTTTSTQLISPQEQNRRYYDQIDPLEVQRRRAKALKDVGF